MTDICLIPYLKIDDIWTIEEHIVREMWKQMVADNTWKTVFSKGIVNNEDTFIEFMRDPKNAIVTVWTDRPLGIAWLNGFDIGTAYCHFCMFSSCWGDLSIKAGHKILEYWFDFKSDGIPFLNVIIGVIPETNSLALKYIQMVGLRIAGVIPKLLYNHYERRNIGGVICYRERED